MTAHGSGDGPGGEAHERNSMRWCRAEAWRASPRHRRSFSATGITHGAGTTRLHVGGGNNSSHNPLPCRTPGTGESGLKKPKTENGTELTGIENFQSQVRFQVPRNQNYYGLFGSNTRLTELTCNNRNWLRHIEAQPKEEGGRGGPTV